ncbi:unnamed protein product [Discula destructiva]
MAENENKLQILTPGVGYGIIIGIGGVFAALMIFITFLQNRYTRFSTHQSEEFNTASRSVKPGLIASGIVSSWTWSATLLTSSTFGYLYGVMGPMFYGALGCFQISLFALVSVKIKANVPGAHTFPEIMLAFHGRPAHISYLFFGLATNMLVGACLVLGGAQVVEALSGMNVYAANWLIPLVVAAYVIVGGLRSTFIADYIHTLILFVVIFVFGMLMYATSPIVGFPGKFYDLLVQASEDMPIDGNAGESYLGFRSVGGIQFAFDLWGAGFTCVFLDQVRDYLKL